MSRARTASGSEGGGAAGAGSRRENLQRLLRPRSVVFIGGRDAATAMRACIEVGFTGEIWCVHPRAEEVAGRPCYRELSALPGVPDAAFVAVRRETTVAVVRELAALGTGGCVCYAAGFAEMGEHGRALQDALIAAAGPMALIGPNCYGVLNYLDRACLWPDVHGGAPVEQGVAVISQSGNISLTVSCQGRSLPLAYVISVGNQAMLGPAPLIEALLDDTRVRAIGLYIEGLDDIPGFSRAAVAALERGVPLVALKAGHSALGARLALTHTSSLAGSEQLYDALFERLGVIRVASLAAMLETLKLLTTTGPLAGPRIASLSCSGGEAALVADRAAQAGLVFSEFSSAQIGKLRADLSEFATICNPFDYNTGIWGRREALERCFTTVMEGQVDVTLLVLDYPLARHNELRDWDMALDAFIAAKQATRTNAVVLSTLPELLPPAARARAIAAGVAPLQGFDEGLAAVVAAAWYGVRRARLLEQDRCWLPPASGSAPARGDVRTLDEWESKRLLAKFGLEVPAGRLVAAEDAVPAAIALGFPVVVKAVGAALVHKTELGAVATGLASGEAVAGAVERIRRAVAPLVGSEIRCIVERMVPDTRAELIVGIRHDEQFGLALVIGSGGILVELVGDSRTLLLPTDAETIAATIDSLKAGTLLAGFRARGPADRQAAVEAVLAVAAFAEAHRDSLVELDVNPLLVGPAGAGAVAVDALITMREGA